MASTTIYVKTTSTASATAPTISGTSFTYYNNEPRALYYTGTTWFVRTTINLSNNGANGTLEYGRNTSSDNVSGASWQTDGQTYSFPAYDTPVTNNANTWNHALGQTRYYYASQDRDTAGTFDSTGGVTYNYVTPNTVTVSNGTVPFGATSYDFTLTNCSTDFGGYQNRGAEVYSVSLVDHGSGEISAATVAGQRFTSAQSTGSSTIVRTVDNANLPANTGGATQTYYVYSYRRPDWSGKEVYIKTDSFVLTRGQPDRTPEGFTNLGGSKTNATPSTTYYATFSTTTVATGDPANAPGLSLGSTIDDGTSISVSNGEWSINKTNWNTSSGTVNASQVVYFRGTSASSGSTTHSLTIGTVTRSFTTNTGSGSITVNMAFDPELGGYTTNISSGTGGGFSSGDARLITAGTTVTFNNVSDPGGPSSEFSSFAQWTNNSTVSISSGSSFTKTWASGVLGNTLDPIRIRTFFGGGNQDQFLYFRQPPVAPDLDVTPSNTTMAYNAGTVNVSVANVTSGETYEVHEENNATSLGSAVASGTSVTITATIGNAQANTSGNLAIGATKTYEIYSRRPGSLGGDNLPNATNDTFTIERLVEPLSNVTDITFSPATTASSTTSVSVSATGGSGGTIQVRQGTSGAWSNAPANFSLTRGTPYTFQARRLGAQSANSTTPIQESYTPPYLLPDLGVAGTSSTIAFVATSATTTISGMARTTDTVAVRLNNGSTNIATRNGDGDITFSSNLPSGGNTTTYELFTRRAVSTGGDGLTFYATNDTFTVTRTAQDTNPNAFSFTDVTDVARNTTQTSNLITVGGITGTVSVSVSGGTYSKNGGAYTASAGTAVNGDTFRVRHTSSSALSTAVNTTLTIGSGANASDTFTSTTVAAEAPTTSSVTFNNPASPNVTATVNLSASGAGGTLQYACEVGDTTPDNWQSSNTFSIPRAASGTVYARARRSATTVSNTVNAAQPGFLLPDDEVSGTSSVIAFVATSATTTVSNVARSTDTVAVRLNNGSTNIATNDGNGDITFSSNLPSGGSTTTYELFTRRATSTGGDGSTFYATNDTFTVERTAQDTNPNGLSFTDVTNVSLNTTQTSNEVTISGITGSVSVSVSGGTYSKNGGAYTASTGSAVSGDKFRVRHTSSSAFSTAVNTTLTVGSGPDSSDTFTSTTLAADTTPNAFSFTDVSNVARSTTQTSNSITVSGLNTSTSVTVSGTGGTYRKNGTGGFVSTTGSAVNGDTFEVRHTSSSSFSTSVTTTLNIGGVTSDFISTTLDEVTTPGSFTFTDVSSVAPSTTQTSNSIEITGINSTANVTVTGGTYRKNGTGSFVSSAGTAVNGDDFEVRHTSSADPLTAVNTTLTVGGVSDTFTSTTRDITAPTANNVTVNNPESATYTATFNLSNVGQDGTLQYAIEKNNSAPSNWTNAATDSTSTFTANFSRTSSPGTIYAQARRSASKTSSIVSVAGRGFIAPANITCSNQNIPTTYSTGLLVSISGGISTKEAYAVSLTSGLTSANVASNSIDVIDPYNGNPFSIPSGNLPSNGNTTTYYLYSKRFTTYGGDGLYDEVGSFTVTRAPTVATPTNFAVTDAVGSEGTYTSSTGTTNNLTADSLAGHTLQFRVDSGTWSTTSSYAHNYGATRVYEARYVRDSDSEVTANPPSITRQVADAEITISPVTSILSTNSTNPLKIADISGATADTQYRVTATGNINGSSVTNLFIDAPVATTSTPDINAANPGELPAAGTSATYTVMARVGAIDDGDGLYRFLRTGIANRSWTLNRTDPGTSPDQFSFSAPTTNDDNINVTVTASYSGSTPAGTIQLSETSNFASIQANGSSFAFVRGTPKTIYARLSNGGEFSTPSSESHTPAYLNAQVNISAPTGFDSNLNFTQSGNQTVSIVGGNIAGNTYRVRRTSPSVVQCGNTGELGASATGTVTLGDAANELPGAGEVFAYDVQAQKSVATGGDGTTWAATGETFSIGRQNNWTFTSVASATGGQQYISSVQVNGLVGTLSATKTGSGDFAVTTGSSSTGATFNSSAKNIQNGNYLHARITASSTPGTTLTQTVAIDGQSSVFGVTTPISGGGGSALYGIRIYSAGGKLLLDTPDRTGQIVTSLSFTANGSTSDLTTNTTTTNLPASFDNFVTEDSEVVVISTGDPKRVRAQVIENAGSPKWAVRATVRGTSNQTLTAIVVSFGDT